MSKTQQRTYTLYKIFYDDFVAYLGRTSQPLQTRLRGHFFARPMHRNIDINGVSRIEYAECATCADMYLYEIYYINLLKPPLNCDDRAKDDLTVSLPELNWESYTCPLMDKWREALAVKDAERKAAKQSEIARFELRRTLRKRHADGELSDEEYDAALEANGF